MMLTAIHLTSGQPCRATELEVLTWRNTKFRVRSVYFSQGMFFLLLLLLFFHFDFSLLIDLFPSYTGTVCILQTYSKTRALTRAEKPIWRFLPKELGRLVALNLSYVKSFEATFTREMYPDSAEAANNVRYFMFVKYGLRFTADNIRDIVSATLSRPLGHFLQFSAYRYPDWISSPPPHFSFSCIVILFHY